MFTYMADKIGVKIVRKLVELGYPKYRLGKDLGVSRQTVYAYCAGQFFDEQKHLQQLRDLAFAFCTKKGLDPFKIFN